MSPVDSVARSILLWRDAVAGLPENPLTYYMLLGLQRRAALLPAWRRNLFALVTGMIAFALAITFAISRFAVEDPAELVSEIVLIVIIPTSLALLVEGFSTAATDLYSVLGTGSRGRGFRLDDMTALSLLSDREIVAGVLRAVLPALLARLGIVAAAALVSTLIVTAGGGTFNDRAFAQVLLFAPISLAGMLLGSGLATLILACSWLGLGRGIVGSSAAIATLLALTGGHFCWWALHMGLLTSRNVDDYSLPVGLLALPLAVWGTLALARHSRIVRFGAVFCGPGGLLLVAILIGLCWLGLSFEFGPAWIAPFMSELSWAWGALMPLNPHFIPSPGCWGAEIASDSLTAVPLFEWYRFPLLLLLQSVLLYLAAEFATAEVRARRKSFL